MVTQALCWNQASPEFRTEPALRVRGVGAALVSPVLSFSSGCVHASRSSSTHKHPYSHMFVSVSSCTHGSPCLQLPQWYPVPWSS